MKSTIRKLALHNAFKFGEASVGSVLGKILAEHPEIKKEKRIPEAKKLVEKTVKEVNKLDTKKILEELEKTAPELLVEKKVKKDLGLRALENVGKQVVMRFEPSPSGPMHLGHAYGLMLNYEYCKMYNGKLILRISDTNPENTYEEAYSLLKQDFDWLCKDVKHEMLIQSDRMDLYYSTALTLLEEGHAYVCMCDGEEFRNLINKKLPCPCRKKGVKEHVKRWKLMLNDEDEESFEQGEAVVRIKTDVKHKNPAMRDYPALRINEEEHPRQGHKYRVWPLLNFTVAVDDHHMGLTHVLRGKDHFDNTRRQIYIFTYMNWKVPQYLHIGRINFDGLQLSCSKTRPLIDDGTYSGWDDIRLPFMLALKRRGYTPEAFKKYAMSVGVTLNDKRVPASEFFKAINAFNKEIIDPQSLRYFFIPKPISVEVKKAPKKKVALDLHPDHAKKGGRTFNTSTKFLLAKHDVDLFKQGKLIRLMECLNFTVKDMKDKKNKKGKDNFEFVDEDYITYKKAKDKAIIHWLPESDDLVEVEVWKANEKDKIEKITGWGESSLQKLRVGETIQFERFGFCKLDEVIGEGKKQKMVFWFAHS
jgi:glutamyl-tRNA synthetase